MGDIRSYPPGSHAGIVVLRLTDQSAPAVSEAITELTNWAELEALMGIWPPRLGKSARLAAEPPAGEH